MPTARVNGLSLFYEDVGEGTPLVFVHEFAGEARSWHLQVRFFARRYRTIAFNARGFPPSDVPDDPKAYSQDLAVEDIRGMLDDLGIQKALKEHRAKRVLEIAESWRPWRSYAVMHLWKSLEN